MTNRYDELSDRARWFLNNFDEIDLADICASQESSNQAREATIGRVRDVLPFAEQVAATSGPGPASAVRAVIDRLLAALDEPAKD